MENKGERIKYIDMAKGIAVLLVIVWHIAAAFNIDLNSTCINAVHNPTFFLASGLLIGYQVKRTNGICHSLFYYTVKLITPFIIWTSIYAVIIKVITSGSIISCLSDGANKVWFLPILYLGTILVLTVYKHNLNHIVVMFILALAVMIFCFSSSFIAKTIAYPLMVYVGFNLEYTSRNKLLIIRVTSLFILCVYFVICNLGLIQAEDIISASGLKLLFFLLASLCGGICLIYLMKLFYDKLKVDFSGISFVGTNSIYFYILHTIGILYLKYTEKTIANSIIGIILCFACPFLCVFTIKKTRLDSILFNVRYNEHKIM
jgi:hypothetical protein